MARTIDDDASKFVGAFPHGCMNPCFGDAYFAADCGAKWGEKEFNAACKKAREQHAKAMERYKNG